MQNTAANSHTNRDILRLLVYKIIDKKVHCGCDYLSMKGLKKWISYYTQHFTWPMVINSLRPSDIYMCQQTTTSLVQIIISTSPAVLSIGPFGINFNEMFIEIHIFSFKKMRLKLSSAKMAAILSGLGELTPTVLLTA